LDSESIQLSEVVELAIIDVHLHGLLLREVRRLEFVPLRSWKALSSSSKRARRFQLKKSMSPR
jgi:hypothetical protein